ncbi:dolichol-phosphate mannosyltransferase subunit 3 [Xylaria curta]|nr:dolichol-phosphate mannosyltransferase subunit 3 [Xylaria curta]
MTRAQQTISIGLLVTSLYLALYLQLVPLPELVQTEIVPVVRMRHPLYLPLLSIRRNPNPQISLPSYRHLAHLDPVQLLTPDTNPQKTRKENTNTYPQLPFWALVSFGAYLLFRLGWNVMTFHDVPEAHKELVGEIELAKQDLRRLGVDVD